MADRPQLASLDCCHTGCDDRIDLGDTGWAAHMAHDGKVRLACPACQALGGGPTAGQPGAPVQLHSNEVALIAIVRNSQRRRMFKASHRDPKHQARVDASGQELGERLSRAGRVLQHIIANPPQDPGT